MNPPKQKSSLGLFANAVNFAASVNKHAYKNAPLKKTNPISESPILYYISA